MFLCDSDGFAEGSFNLGVVGTNRRQKHTAEPVQFGRPPALFTFFGEGFCLPYRIKSFGGTIRRVQSFGLS
jgi:hypothetical protein